LLAGVDMKSYVFLSIVGALTTTTALDAKWTPADDEAPLPLSKKYRDKLDELESKVGADKFKELTGMTPLSQTAGNAAYAHANGKRGESSSFQGVLVSALANLVPKTHLRSVACVAVGVGVACVGYSALEHSKRTGFRLPVFLLPLLLPLLDAHACKLQDSLSEGWGGAYVSLQPPPQLKIKEWVRACAATAEQSSAFSSLLTSLFSPESDSGGVGGSRVERVLLGHGAASHRSARDALRALRVCSYGDDSQVEMTAVDDSFVGFLSHSAIRDDDDDDSNSSSADETGNSGLWWLIPMRIVAQESKWEEEGAGRGRVRVDAVEMAVVADTAAPPWWRGGRRLGMRVEFHEKSEQVYFAACVDGNKDDDGGKARAVVTEALLRSMQKTGRQEERVRSARRRSHSKYQGEADRAFAAKKVAKRGLSLERGDVRANLRFRGGALLPSLLYPNGPVYYRHKRGGRTGF